MVMEVEICVERDAGEEPLHVLEGIDGDADLAHLADAPWGRRSRSRSAWADRRPRRAPRCHAPAEIYSGGWTPRHRPCRRTGAWSTGGRDTWWSGCRGCRDTRPDSRDRGPRSKPRAAGKIVCGPCCRRGGGRGAAKQQSRLRDRWLRRRCPSSPRLAVAARRFQERSCQQK